MAPGIKEPKASSCIQQKQKSHEHIAVNPPKFLLLIGCLELLVVCYSYKKFANFFISSWTVTQTGIFGIVQSIQLAEFGQSTRVAGMKLRKISKPVNTMGAQEFSIQEQDAEHTTKHFSHWEILRMNFKIAIRYIQGWKSEYDKFKRCSKTLSCWLRFKSNLEEWNKWWCLFKQTLLSYKFTTGH